MAEGLGTSVSVREGQNSGRARPAPEDGRLDSYGTDCSTPLKGTPGCEPQGRRKFGCATRPGRPRAVETRHRLAPPCCRPQRPGSGCRRRNRRLNTLSGVWGKARGGDTGASPGTVPWKNGPSEPQAAPRAPATGSWTFSCSAVRRAVVRPRVLITRKAQAGVCSRTLAQENPGLRFGPAGRGWASRTRSRLTVGSAPRGWLSSLVHLFTKAPSGRRAARRPRLSAEDARPGGGGRGGRFHAISRVPLWVLLSSAQERPPFSTPVPVGDVTGGSGARRGDQPLGQKAARVT